MNLLVSPRVVLKWLLIIIGFLLFANVVGVIFKHFIGHDYIYGLVPLFRFGTEQNVPTLYSSIALVASSLVLLYIAMAHRKRGSSYKLWLGMAAIFLFLSIDEFASLHERLINPVREALGTSGVFFLAWVIPYALLLLVFLLVYARFLFQLPKEIMVLFIVSGVVFVFGAVGMEMVQSFYAEMHGYDTLQNSIITTLEELFEKLGVALFIYALLRYVVVQFGAITLTLGDHK